MITLCRASGLLRVELHLRIVLRRRKWITFIVTGTKDAKN